LNNIGWYALFTGKVEDADIATAIKSTQMAKDNPSILHTLACLYAEVGRTKEAHDLLLRGMDDMNLDEPNDATGMPSAASPSNMASARSPLPITASWKNRSARWKYPPLPTGWRKCASKSWARISPQTVSEPAVRRFTLL